MENASKALLIAGAILIAIVLISLGVMILGQGSNLVKNANMSDAEITTYNSEWEQFVGGNIGGNLVRQMINKVSQHNSSNSDDVSKQIQLYTTAPGAAKDGEDLNSVDNSSISTSNVGTGYSYTVTALKSTGGLVNRIYFVKN